MSKYRNHLPQLGDDLFLTDGGLETTLVFHDGIDLPHFAAFVLMREEGGIARLRRYYEDYIAIARERDLGFVLEAPTWRASPDWGARLGYDDQALAEANRQSIELLETLRQAHEVPGRPLVVSGNVGPRRDGYRAGTPMSADEARAYHSPQLETFAGTTADMASALTLTYTAEAVGIALAARDAGLPVAISFTVETDGRLPSGETLAAAIEATDRDTGGYPAYYMVNCAHPTHFAHVVGEGGGWRDRIRGLRANASRRSHAELDESTDLDDGDPVELGHQYREMKGLLPGLTVMGGCCGTDHRHVAAISEACA